MYCDTITSGYLNAKKQPLKAHEDIVVFYKKQTTYNPQFTIGTPYDKGKAVRDTEAYGKQTKAVHVKILKGRDILVVCYTLRPQKEKVNIIQHRNLLHYMNI